MVDSCCRWTLAWVEMNSENRRHCLDCRSRRDHPASLAPLLGWWCPFKRCPSRPTPDCYFFGSTCTKTAESLGTALAQSSASLLQAMRSHPVLIDSPDFSATATNFSCARMPGTASEKGPRPWAGCIASTAERGLSSSLPRSVSALYRLPSAERGYCPVG